MKVIRDQNFITFCEMLGSNMRFCRLKFGMPQKSLAYHISVSHQNVQKYEAGDIIPSAYRLKQIADFYKVKTELENKIEILNYSSVEWRPLNYINLGKEQSEQIADVLNAFADSMTSK
mgnify:CR=1 FL=1